MPSSTTPMPQWAFDGINGPPRELNQYVREVQSYTCDTDCNFHPTRASYWYIGETPEPEFNPMYHECVERLGEFLDVRSIILYFDRYASGGHASYGEIFQESAF